MRVTVVGQWSRDRSRLAFFVAMLIETVQSELDMQERQTLPTVNAALPTQDLKKKPPSGRMNSHDVTG